MKKKLIKTIETDVELDKLSFNFYKSDTLENIDGYDVFPIFVNVNFDGKLITDKKVNNILTKQKEKQLSNILDDIIASLNLT